MTSTKSWGIDNQADDKCYVALYVSRKKDNNNVDDFVERRKSFIFTEAKYFKYADEFSHFVDDGVPGETSRMYISVNARSMVSVRNQLLHFLIDNPDFNLCSIDSKLAAIAAKKECAIEKRWMIDFDSTDAGLLDALMKEIKEKDDTINFDVYNTPNGYGLIASHGFNTVDFSDKWGHIATIKKDDLRFVQSGTKQ
jgi:hypothetical protein